MAKLIDLPSEVLMEICLQVFLSSESDFLLEPSLQPGEDDLPYYNRLSLICDYSNSKARTNSFTTDISAIHACKGGAVDEFYDATCRHRCPRKSLLALSLTCKRLHEIVEPLLWSIVETDQESEGSVGDLLRILHSVTKRPALGHNIKALAFRHFYISPDGSYDHFTRSEQASLSGLLEMDATHQVAALLDLLPNLRTMKLAIELEPDYFSVFQPSTLYPTGFPLGLQNLTEFSFHWEDPDADAFYASLILPLFLLPSLKTLYLGHPMAAAQEEDLHDFTRYYGTSSVTHLIIDFGNVEVPAINAYLKLPKALETFQYSYGGGSNRCGNADIGGYYRALLPQKSSLKTLKIRGCRDMQSYEDEEAPDPNILKSFTSVQEFAVPIRLLLFREQSGVTHYKMEDVLPPNVEKVTLFAYDDWTFDALHEKLKNFFSFGKSRFSNLKEMRVEIWLTGEDYSLHVQKMGNEEEDWSEVESVIGWRVESLKQRAKDKGVRLEAELDTASKTQIWR